MARYTDEFRAQAIVMLEAAGWPERKGAIARTAATLHIHQRTLSRWASRQQNPPPDILVHKKRFDLQAAIQDELQAVIEELPSARPDADYKELITALAILVDKSQLLEGKATERVELLTEQERTNRLTELLDAARNRRDGRADSFVQ
jgi:transposase-like protein